VFIACYAALFIAISTFLGLWAAVHGGDWIALYAGFFYGVLLSPIGALLAAVYPAAIAVALVWDRPIIPAAAISIGPLFLVPPILAVASEVVFSNAPGLVPILILLAGVAAPPLLILLARFSLSPFSARASHCPTCFYNNKGRPDRPCPRCKGFDFRSSRYLKCPACAYDLRGLPPNSSCPECAAPPPQARPTPAPVAATSATDLWD